VAAVHAPFAVAEPSQVGHVRRAAVRLAERSHFSEQTCAEVAIVATELATNLVRYGRNGRLFLQPVTDAGGTFVEMLAVDSGDGMADVQRSLQDGVSTGGTPGTGLGAIRRLSQQFDIFSTIGKGTVVLARVGKRTGSGNQSLPQFQAAALATTAPGEVVSGDAWRVAESDGNLAILIADGLGHGPLAAEAADRAAAAFDEDPFKDGPGDFCDRAHRVLSGSRGAALACAHLSSSGRVTYAGVGNISGSIVAAQQSKGLSSQNGTAGAQMRRAQSFVYELPDRGVLVMHSDGLTSRWTLNDYPGLVSRHAAVIAGVLHRDYLRGKDDATVVVIRKMGPR
jgi:anti-sigma regulatory factor (Ser/Thr protein kinase)